MLAARLKDTILDSGQSQKEIAERAGLAANTLSNYVTGKRTPDALIAARLAQMLDVEVGWLLTGEGSRHSIDIVRRPAIDDLVTQVRQSEEHVNVPIYEGPLGAGSPGEPSDAIIGYGSFLRRWLTREVRIDPLKAFVAPVYGDSMVRVLFDGDLVLGEHIEEYQSDGIHAVVLNGDLYVKHLERTGPRTARLKSENTRYSDIEVTEHDSFRILGRIVRRLTGLY